MLWLEMNDRHTGNNENYPQTVTSAAFSSELGHFICTYLLNVNFFLS
jgi:hypothetical protein